MPRVLVVGGGYLHELSQVPPPLRLTVVDVDARVTEHLSSVSDPRIERCLTVGSGPDALPPGPFDGIYAKEVIEHIVDLPPYLRTLVGRLAPGGRVWLSTPNYGDPVLPILESTVLEWIGRVSGYSRKGIHPTRLSSRRLAAELTAAGLVDVTVEKTPYRLALVGEGQRPLMPTAE
jgi:hypothetical protein